MTDKIFIDQTKPQLKGNLHAHTTASDGRYSFEEVAEKYLNDNYDFLAITDHGIFFDGPLNYKDLTIIPGIEIHCYYQKDKELKNPPYVHFNLLFDQLTKQQFTSYRYQTIDELQAIIHKLNQTNGVLQFNHPLISKHPEQLVVNLKDYQLIEVRNTKDFIDGSGLDSLDNLVLSALRQGHRFFVTATDDYHGKYDLEIDPLYRQAFIATQCANNPTAILEAVKTGQFYTSTGPRIYDYRLEAGVLKLKTDPVKQINFYTNQKRCQKIYNPNGLVDTGDYQIKDKDTFIWAVITAPNGDKAWLQPYWLD